MLLTLTHKFKSLKTKRMNEKKKTQRIYGNNNRTLVNEKESNQIKKNKSN